MGQCQSQDNSASKVEVSGDCLVVTTPTGVDEVPLWKQQVESFKVAAEEAEKLRTEYEAKCKADEAAAAAKRQEEADAAAAKAAAPKKKAAAPKKQGTSAKKKPAKAADAAAADAHAAEAPAAAPAEAPAAAAAGAKLDRQQIKEREQAYKARPQKEQDDLGKQIRAAAKEGNQMEVKTLLDSGVIPNVPDKDGWTALHEAAQAGQSEVCSLLLDYGADPKLTIKLGEWGMTPLHYAARNGHLECAKLLAPVSKLAEKNFQSKTAAEVAKANNHKEIAKVCKPKAA